MSKKLSIKERTEKIKAALEKGFYVMGEFDPVNLPNKFMALKVINGNIVFNSGKYPSLDGTEQIKVTVPVMIEDFDAG